MNTTDDTLAPDVKAKQLAEEYTALAEQAEHIKHRQDEIKALLAELLPEGGPAGNHQVTVTRPRRIDPKAIEKAFPVHVRPELYVPRVDTAAVRKHIAEVDLDPFLTEGRPTVTVK